MPKCHSIFETEVHDLPERLIALFEKADVDHRDVLFEYSRSTGISKELKSHLVSPPSAVYLPIYASKRYRRLDV